MLLSGSLPKYDRFIYCFVCASTVCARCALCAIFICRAQLVLLPQKKDQEWKYTLSLLLVEWFSARRTRRYHRTNENKMSETKNEQRPIGQLPFVVCNLFYSLTESISLCVCIVYRLVHTNFSNIYWASRALLCFLLFVHFAVAVAGFSLLPAPPPSPLIAWPILAFNSLIHVSVAARPIWTRIRHHRVYLLLIQ